jgi:phage terminase large subunit-like protein
MKLKPPSITSLQFFGKLSWLDGKPLVIEPYRQRIFQQVLDTYRPDGAPQFNQALLGRGKKNAKSLDLILAAFYCTIIRRAVQGNAAIIIAGDEAQAGDDLDLAKKLVEANRATLGAEFSIQAKELKLRDGSGGIKILPAGMPGGLHGKQYSFLGTDEVHNQNDWRVLEALQPDPHRRDCLVWVTSYDSVLDEPGTPLHDLKKLGMAGSDERFYFSWYSGDHVTDPDFAGLEPELRANPSMSTWPEGRSYLDQQRLRLPDNIFRRLHLNLPATASSFIDMARWDACVDEDWREVLHDKSLRVYAGADAGHKHDSSAVAAVYYDEDEKRVKLVFHRIFVPQRNKPLDFDSSIGETLRVLKKRYNLVQCLFDPWQMQALAQQLTREKIPIEEFNQTPGNLTAASQNLFDLINGRNLVLYPDRDLRLAASRAIATEMPRGWKIDKSKQSHRIDCIVALAMACHAAVEGQGKPQGLTGEMCRRGIEQAERMGVRNRMGRGSPQQIYGERKWLQMQRRWGADRY